MIVDAFLLASEWSDGERHILRFWAKSPAHGAVEIVVDDVPPVLFVRRDAPLPSDTSFVRRCEIGLVTFTGAPVDALYFATWRAAQAAAARLRVVGVQPYESDVRPDARFMMERFLAGQVRLEGEPRFVDGHVRFVNPQIRPAAPEIDATDALVIASVDIETGVATDTLYAVGVHVTGAGHGHCRIFMLGESDPRADADVSFHVDERALLEAYLAWWTQIDPDVLIGWSVIDFDLRYLARKAEEIGVPFRLGRGGGVPRFRRGGGRRYFVDLPGRVVLDGPPTLRAAFYDFTDQSLEGVSQKLLGEGKTITLRGEAKLAELDRQFREDRAALARYNRQDCILVTRIFERTALIPLWVRRTRLSGLLMGDVGRSAAAFDHFYLPRLHRRGYVAPDVADVAEGRHTAGGHIFEPVVGLHGRVAILDFKSLYPTIIRTFGIDPLARLAAADDPLWLPTGQRFSRRQHILPAFIGELMARRAEAKRAGDVHLSQAIKILMNSFYGVMGSFGCRFYDSDLPSAITGMGQYILRRTRDRLEARGHRVLYGDTDSVFVALPEADDDADAHDRGAILARDLTEWWRTRIEAEFQLESHLEVELDKNFETLFMPPVRHGSAGAKKRYVGRVIDTDGPRLHFVGVETVRSDWSPLAKRFQRELFTHLFDGAPLEPWMRQFVVDLRAGRFDDLLVFSRRLRRPLDTYGRRPPPHVQAARLVERPGMPDRHIEYVMTRRGPIPVALPHADPDHGHYVERQLAPIADTVLALDGRSFRDIVGACQLALL